MVSTMELLVIFALVAAVGLIAFYRKKKRNQFPPIDAQNKSNGGSGEEKP